MSNPTGVNTVNPYDYWNNIVPTNAEACALCLSLGMLIPPYEQDEASLRFLLYPVRRLTMTGLDTAQNFTLLLGPDWARRAAHVIRPVRLEVLIDPQPGSWSHLRSRILDIGLPRRTPRAPSAVELARLAKVEEMRVVIAQQMGERKKLKEDDYRALVAGQGPNWRQNQPSMLIAIECWDQGEG